LFESFLTVGSLHTQTHPHSVGRFFTYDQPDAETSKQQHTTLTTDTNPCTLRDLNPQSQQSRGRKHTSYIARPLRSAGFLSVMQKVMDCGEQEERVTVCCLVVYLEKISEDGVCSKTFWSLRWLLVCCFFTAMFLY